MTRLAGRISLLAVVTASLLGCTVTKLDVEAVPRLKAVEIHDRQELAPVGLSSVSINLRRGTVIGGYMKDLAVCSRHVPDSLAWNSGRVSQRNIEFEDAFFESLTAANFNVVGDPKDLFREARRETVEPEYLIGAQIEDIRMNICDHMDFWTARPTGNQTGEASTRVTWQVFSVFDRKVIYQTETKGSVEITEPNPGGEILMITEAFAEAAANLAADATLVDLLRQKPRTVADVRAVTGVSVKIPYRPLFDTRITDNIDLIRRAVVTLDNGAGHGSGFFISPTLIMTNRHVIANTTIVRVQLVTGRKVLGEVIRQHPERDVALVQVEDAGHQPLPLRLEPARITEEVYAVGSPLDKALAGTVSKGIVSKFGTNEYGLEDIQADVDIHSGNSGGALLDERGNVVGVSYAGIGTGDQTSVGLNFFIPIYDALDKLNVVIDRTRGLTVAR